MNIEVITIDHRYSERWSDWRSRCAMRALKSVSKNSYLTCFLTYKFMKPKIVSIVLYYYGVMVKYWMN